ncbi:MAG: protein translocase subunit SecF, partial [Neisseriaceae bacterium]|nr:protein translocase subunit SecF [Neisseriaceae bacterium]
FFFGGDVLHGFSIALTIGILFGIYSSIFVGSPLLLMFGLTRETLAKKNVKKEEAVV